MALKMKKKRDYDEELTQEEKELAEETEVQESVSTELMDRAKVLIEDTFNLKDKNYQLTGFGIKKTCVQVTVSNADFELSVSIFNPDLLGIDK